MIYLKLNIKTTLTVSYDRGIIFDGTFINFFLAMIILGYKFKFDIQTKISLTV